MFTEKNVHLKYEILRDNRGPLMHEFMDLLPQGDVDANSGDVITFSFSD